MCDAEEAATASDEAEQVVRLAGLQVQGSRKRRFIELRRAAASFEHAIE